MRQINAEERDKTPSLIQLPSRFNFKDFRFFSFINAYDSNLAPSYPIEFC